MNNIYRVRFELDLDCDEYTKLLKFCDDNHIKILFCRGKPKTQK